MLTAYVMVMYPLMQIINFSDPDKLCFLKPYIYASNPVLAAFSCTLATFHAALISIASLIASICLYVYYN